MVVEDSHNGAYLAVQTVLVDDPCISRVVRKTDGGRLGYGEVYLQWPFVSRDRSMVRGIRTFVMITISSRRSLSSLIAFPRMPYKPVPILEHE